ncbi:bacteriohemerythrin [Campylobacter coli]|nr:bacteriohemerythrin [Campylobacter coli]CDG56445.1 Hemerythrin-like iron-binding protein [Campylobacter coli 76339]
MYNLENNFSMYDELLDKQHLNLYKLSNKLSLMNKRCVSSKEIKIVLKELLILLNHHFSDEEAFMQHIQYPDLSAHLRIHRRILMQVENIIISNSKFINVMTEGLDKVLKDIIHIHITEEDTKVSLYYEQKFIYKK